MGNHRILLLDCDFTSDEVVCHGPASEHPMFTSNQNWIENRRLWLSTLSLGAA
jgi:hypothetical protein